MSTINPIQETSQTRVCSYILERTCLVKTSVARATGFFVSKNGMLATVFHILTKWGNTPFCEDITVKYRGRNYSVKFTEGFQSTLSNGKDIENIDLCLLQITQPIVTYYFSNIHHSFKQLLVGAEILFAGIPCEETAATVHKGMVSSIRLGKDQIQRFTVDGTIVASHAGSPITHVHNDTPYLIGMVCKTASQVFEGFIAHMNALHQSSNLGSLPITEAAEIRSSDTANTSSFVLRNLLLDQLNLLEKTVSTGIGKAIHSQHILEMMQPTGITYPSPLKNSSNLKQEIPTSPTALYLPSSCLIPRMEFSPLEIKFLKLFSYIINHAENIEVIKEAEEMRDILLQKKNGMEEIQKRSKDIRKLDLSGRFLEDLPSELSLLSGLTYLDLTYNNLKEIPEVVFELHELRVLILRGNKVETLPHKLLEIPHLNLLNILQNPIKKVPSKMSEIIRDLPYMAEWI